MLIGKPEITADKAACILRLAQIREQTVGIESKSIDVINRKVAADSRGILTHREIHSRPEFLPVGAHLHRPAEGIDIDGERLQYHFVHANLPEFLFQILSRLVGAVPGIAAALVPGRT